MTRVRADLSRAALATDLVVAATQDQSTLSRFRQVTKELNQPLCPVWSGCTQVGQAPRDEARRRSSPVTYDPSNEGFDDGCAATSRREKGGWLGAALGFAALAAMKVMRRRREEA